MPRNRFVSSLATLFAARRSGSVRRSPRTTTRHVSKLGLVALDERIVPDSGGSIVYSASDNIPYGGGPLLSRVQIHPIYFVDSTTNLSSPYQSELNAFLGDIVTNGYIIDTVGEYSVPGYTIQNGTVVAPDIVTVDPDLSFSGSSGTQIPGISTDLIEQTIAQEIQAGRTGTMTANSLFVAFLPPGDIISTGSSNSVNDFLAFHTFSSITVNGQQFAWACIPHQESPNGDTGYGTTPLQGITIAVTHELAEAITDPNVTDGWFDPNTAALDGGENADHSAYNDYTLNGYMVESAWSNVLQGHAQAVGTGPFDLYIDQMTPPAVTSFSPAGGPVASFTTNNLSLTPSNFTATVEVRANNSNTPWTVTSITGGNGRFVINAKPTSALTAGSYGAKFDGTNNGMFIVITDNVDSLPGGSKPMVMRSVPFVVRPAGASTPLTYNAEKNPTPHSYRLYQQNGNFEITDASNRVFLQAVADTGSININADPRGSDSSLTIDYTTGAFTNPVTFNGGTGTATHTLSFVGAGSLSVITTGPRSGIVTTNGQTITYFNVTQLIGGSPITVSTLPGGKVDVAYSTILAGAGGTGGPYAYTIASGALPAGLTLTSTGQLSGTPTAEGTYDFTVRVAAVGGDFSTIPLEVVILPADETTTVSPPVAAPPPPPPPPATVPPTAPPAPPPVATGPIGTSFAVATDAGGSGKVTFYNPDNSIHSEITPFPGLTGGIRIAVADFNGDGFDDLAIGTGPGGAGSHIEIYDGVTRDVMFSIDPFESSFTGGVYVAAGDLNGDGIAELIVTPDQGGGPRCRIFSGPTFRQVADLFGIEDPNFRGGARAAVGDINGDGIGDLIIAAGFGGGPRVAVFNGATLFQPIAPGQLPPKLFGDILAFESGQQNGIFVAAGDMDGDGKAELIAGAGPGGGPRVSVFAGSDLVNNVQTRMADFFAGDTKNRGGVRVTVKELDGATNTLLTGSGTGGGSRVTSYPGSSLKGSKPSVGVVFDAFPGFSGGVFVG